MHAVKAQISLQFLTDKSAAECTSKERSPWSDCLDVQADLSCPCSYKCCFLQLHGIYAVKQDKFLSVFFVDSSTAWSSVELLMMQTKAMVS